MQAFFLGIPWKGRYGFIMSRLDSFIRRLCAQRDCLGWVCDALADHPGVILELGLGNGRTYDHLRRLFPDREIFVFERTVAAHPDCIPDNDHCFLGDFRDSLPNSLPRLAGLACLVHADIGSGDSAATAALADAIAPLLVPLLQSGAYILSDQPLAIKDCHAIAVPTSVPAGRYTIQQYRGS
ncbi:MAG: class I SAM-dependent methyltransferase [Pseudomonadota bacterium]